MNLSTKEITIGEFEGVIKKLPPIFDEILAKLVAEYDLPEKDITLLKNDVLFILLVVIMIENNFQPKVDTGELLEDVGQIDSKRLLNWKLSGMYEAEFMMGYCEISTKLMMIPLGSTVLVNGVIKGEESETYSVCLPINQYIVFTVRETEGTVTKLFRNLQLLSDTFKDKVLTPVKSKLLSICGYPGASLMGLPEDVFWKIMLYLPLVDILSMCETCRKFKTLVNDDNLWLKLFTRDFKLLTKNKQNQEDPSEYKNWKAMYMANYLGL